MVVAAVFSALGDPVRLEMVRRLTSGQPSTISVVSDGLGITRQGARKHLQVLADAGLVTLQPKGREVAVELDLETLEPIGETSLADALVEQGLAKLVSEIN